jgi:phosphoglycolate phosphatase
MSCFAISSTQPSEIKLLCNPSGPAFPAMSCFVPGTQIEIINRHIERGHIRFALFDFDGTISLIREGWQGIMIPMMVEILLETPDHESEAELTHVVTEFVTRLTGKQTIYQMIQLAAEVEKRGGTPEQPLHYKHAYLERLWTRIEDRVAHLKAGRRNPEELTVPGALNLLAALRARDITCYLASGTDRPYVLDEAGALGLPRFFDGRIYGALEDYTNFSKRMVIERILRENHLAGPELVAFGDGFVEIEDAKAVGGIAVGVASNEATRQGIDAWKRDRLIQAGADLIIPDFREYKVLVEYLFPTVDA